MHFEQLFFFYCGLSSVQGGGEIMRTQWTQTVLRASCLVITAQLPEALWGPAQGPHPHLAGSPRSDLYDTGDMCEFDANEYIWCHFPWPPKEPGSLDWEWLWLWSHVGPAVITPQDTWPMGYRILFFLEWAACLTLTPEPPGEGVGPELTDTWGSLTALPLALVCSPLIKDYQNIFLKRKPENHHPVLPPSVTPAAHGVPSCLPSSPPERQSHHTRCMGVACALSGHLCSLPGQLHPGGHNELCAPWGELDAPLCFPQSLVNPLKATGIPQHLWVPDGGPALCIPRAPPWVVVPPHPPPWPGGLGCGNSLQSPPTLICLTALFIHPSLQDQDVHITPMLWTDLALILMQVSQLHLSLYETLGKLECWTFNEMNEL